MKNTGEHYDWQGLVIITFLMLFGVGAIYFTWGNNSVTLDNIYNYIYSYGLIAIISIFFISIGIYCWYTYIVNVWPKPKETVMFLKEIDSNSPYPIFTFMDNKGNTIMFTNEPDMFDESEQSTYEKGKFYKVLKTKNKIYKILETSTQTFEIKKEKVSYWLNWYSPMGYFENLLLLPILYVMFIPGLLSFLMANGFDKIYGIAFSAYPGYLIVYDIVQKVKRK
ncbi:MAG TPA: hypothetical protein DEP72_07920 [Clostridiales bacterium]|nr:MAG: hypothetical protein A2Y18_06635 [Clostridiales bacterium GWD2_32_19]HCC08063.1 hypothetical protein [Clostridiales bacterium]